MMFNFFQCVCINLAKIVKGERNTKSSLFEFCFPSRILSWSFSSKITTNEREIRSLLLYLSLRVQKIFDLSKMVKERNTKSSLFEFCFPSRILSSRFISKMVKERNTKKRMTKKALLLLCSPSKCSFTLSKLRFFSLRTPKNSSFYSTS